MMVAALLSLSRPIGSDEGRSMVNGAGPKFDGVPTTSSPMVEEAGANCMFYFGSACTSK